jgi:serine/threonine protein kinase
MGSVSIEQYLDRVADSGLISDADLKSTFEELSASGQETDAETFAKQLVQQKKLTVYQAQQCYLGKGKQLVLGNYVILDKLGQGGMGMVLKAEHRRMERIVALKILAPAITKNPDALRRFQQEVKVAAKLTHPNIATAYDADIAGTTHFLVMEYVDGRDLASIVASEGRLPIPQAIDVIRQAAKGLAYAHGKGIIHRDIKPANLLLDKEGTVKILDMGLARMDDPAAQAGLTQSGEVMGTVDYMAPEQAMDVRKADVRSDIYSLGCTLYRLLTAENLFEGETIVQKLMAHQQRAIPSLTSKRTDVPAALSAIFGRMVAKRPEERFQTMAEVETSLASLSSTSVPTAKASRSLDADSRLTAFFSELQQHSVAKGSAKASGSADAPAIPLTGATVAIQKTLTAGAPHQPEADDSESEGGVMTGTLSTSHAALETDTVTTHLSPLKPSVQPVSPATKPETATKSKRAFPPLQRWLLIACAGGTLLAALGVWVIIRDKDGKEVARIPVPEGGSAALSNETDLKPQTAPLKASNDPKLMPATKPPEKPPAAAPSGRNESEPDERELAEWLISRGSRFNVYEYSNPTKGVAVEAVANLPNSPIFITSVFLGSNRIFTVEDAKKLSDAKRIHTIYFSHRGQLFFEPGAIRALKAMPSLRGINLGDNNPDADLLEILELKNLVHIQIVSIASDEFVSRLGELPELESVDLLGSKGVTDEGIVNYSKSQPAKLTKLGLRGTKIGIRGLEALKDFPRLQELSLQETQIKDSDLDALVGVSQLVHVKLGGNLVTQQGIQSFWDKSRCLLPGLPPGISPKIYSSERYQHSIRHLHEQGYTLTIIHDNGAEQIGRKPLPMVPLGWVKTGVQMSLLPLRTWSKSVN